MAEDQKQKRKKQGPFCSMCSTEGKRRYHQHWSLNEQRVNAIIFSDKNEFLCPICREMEKALRGENETRRVVLTDDFLWGVWLEENKPEKMEHFDLECIVSGKVRHLKQALKSNHLLHTARVEVIVCCGLYNVSSGEAPADIIKEMLELKEMVLRHSLINRHSPPSYVSFCSLPYPPRLCSLHLPLNAVGLDEWKPKAGFVDRKKQIEEVNAAIKEMNTADDVHWASLHLQGIKIFKSGNKQHKYDTKPNSKRVWEEDEVFKKFHFTMEVKLKILSYINNCFKANAEKMERNKQKQ